METVRKQTRTQADPVEGELAAINALGNTSLTAEEVYPFGVRLCDNQTDRDLEYFARADLEQLAALFVGKTGIFDHSWSAKDQRARIYRTELVEEPGVVTEAGEPGCYLKGYAYMLRTAENAGLIAEIEGGIKKEVSVSCAVRRQVCSICGHDIHDRGQCSHGKGQVYGEKRCIVRLAEPTDAFEWSFVAVPAQPRAGVVKGFQPGTTLRQALAAWDRDGVWQAELDQLEKEAAAGRRHLEAPAPGDGALGPAGGAGPGGSDLAGHRRQAEPGGTGGPAGLLCQAAGGAASPAGAAALRRGDNPGGGGAGPLLRDLRKGGRQMSVAFDGMDNLVVTFRCSGTVEAGSPVILSANDTVADGGTGKAPIGVLLQKRGNYAAVQIRGYVTLPYTGTAPALGWQELMTNGSQGLRTVTTGEAGKACLVVRVDEETSTLGLFL